VVSRNIFNDPIHVSGNFAGALDDLANADRADVQAIAASQLKLLAAFYEVALHQAKQSFRWAIIGSIVGLAFFVVAIALVLGADNPDAALVSAVSGGIVEVIAGINFTLYGKTTSQLLSLHGRLEQTQRFLLADSICEALPEGDARSAARTELIRTIAGHPGP
jgi:hypothetical protein